LLRNVGNLLRASSPNRAVVPSNGEILILSPHAHMTFMRNGDMQVAMYTVLDIPYMYQCISMEANSKVGDSSNTIAEASLQIRKYVPAWRSLLLASRRKGTID
jgi:hypothetical protein